MRWRILARWVGWVAVAAWLGACARTDEAPVIPEAGAGAGGSMLMAEEPLVAPGNSSGTEMLDASKSERPQTYRFQPGDELAVHAVNRPELRVTARVDPYGYIAYPYLGQVSVKNLSPAELAERLTQGLKDGGYYVRPMLSVAFIASKDQFVYVLGEVKKPGPVSISSRISLLEALGRAGGQTYDSEMSSVMWIRGTQTPPGVVKINLEDFGNRWAGKPIIPNLTMIPGDVLYVPDSTFVATVRFFSRMYVIIRTFVELERGLVLYPEVERFLRGQSNDPNNTVIFLDLGGSGGGGGLTP